MYETTALTTASTTDTSYETKQSVLNPSLNITLQSVNNYNSSNYEEVAYYTITTISTVNIVIKVSNITSINSTRTTITYTESGYSVSKSTTATTYLRYLKNNNIITFNSTRLYRRTTRFDDGRTVSSNYDREASTAIYSSNLRNNGSFSSFRGYITSWLNSCNENTSYSYTKTAYDGIANISITNSFTSIYNDKNGIITAKSTYISHGTGKMNNTLTHINSNCTIYDQEFTTASGTITVTTNTIYYTGEATTAYSGISSSTYIPD